MKAIPLQAQRFPGVWGGLFQLKIPLTPSEIEPGTFRPVAQCLKQMRQRFPHLHMLHTLIIHVLQGNATWSGTAARLRDVKVCSIVLSRRLLFELPEQSTALPVLCLTVSDMAILSTPISLILYCQVKCAWEPQSAWLAQLPRTSCRVSLRGIEVRCSTPGRSKWLVISSKR